MSRSLPTPAVFSVAEGRRIGLTRREIDRGGFERPFHGVRALPDTPPDARAAALRAASAYATRMREGEFFSHLTAAHLWHLPLPYLRDDTLHVSTLPPLHAARCARVHGHQLATAGVKIVVHPETGLPVTDPATTWALLGRLLFDPYDLVAIADAVLRVDRVAGPHGFVKRPALASMEELQAAILPGRRGALALRAALAVARTGAASRMETRTRLTLIDGGLPEPVLDWDVYEDGEFIGCVDMAYPELRIAVEYEGSQHFTDRAQWMRDIDKYEKLAAAGWTVIRVTKEMLRGPAPLISRVRTALLACR